MEATYLLIVDYYSRWIEIARLNQLTSSAVVQHTKSVFARYGIPSDNGPQYASDLYARFAKEYGFKHTTSSPYHPQGNGEAERAIKMVKNLLKKSGDPYLAIFYSLRSFFLKKCIYTTKVIKMQLSQGDG